MLRIRRYLRPYLLMLTASVILLFAQANLDLALPDYLSRIVNTGIQQSGVESPVPLAMRRETLEHLASFMDADDERAMRAAYRLIDAGSPGYETYAAQYPLLADEPIYVREETGRDEIERLSEPMARALLVVATLEQARADPALAAQIRR
jgi:ATP-binding cassette, subfamily B, multidrug efflux pump